MVNLTFLKYTSISCRGKAYSCSQSDRKGSQFVALAEWDLALFGPPSTPIPEPAHPDSRFRPVRIKHYIKVSVVVGDSEPQDHPSLVVVSWYLPHTNTNVVRKPAQIWCQKFEIMCPFICICAVFEGLVCFLYIHCYGRICTCGCASK